MKAKYLKMVFSITGQIMSMVKIQNGKALRVDPRSMALYDGPTVSKESYWTEEAGYVYATAADFDTYYCNTVKSLDNFLNPSEYERAI